jgi:2-polyprenyl-6-methoxyphenol hydroxylase-like FAD-dependent oxidoreductase
MSAFPGEIDVLIAGAGPVGLTLATELMRQGVKSVIVDRQAEGANTSRAAVVHARTLEVLEPLGVVQELIQQGLKVPTFRVRDRDRALITIDFTGIPSAYPFTLMCPQNRTERILLRRLEALGNVVRPSEFIRSDRDGAHINAQISANGVTSTVKARWLVALGSNISVSAPFVWRCLTGSTMAPFSHPAHR